MKTMGFQTLETFDTKYSADSVEWCPAEGYEDIFVCGTYQLETQETRVGRIYLFQIVKAEEDQVSLKLLQHLDGAGVLDTKWAHVKCCGKVLLGVARFTGHLQIYELVEDSEKARLTIVAEVLIRDEGQSQPIALSLDWSTGRREPSDNANVKITVSDSHGSVSLFQLSDDANGLRKIFSGHGHDFEAWIAAFDYWDTNVVYTGGDDGKFLTFDTRMDGDVLKANFTNRSHEAGVTSFHSNWKKQFYLVSGSYDENLRTWDTRNLRQPMEQLNLGGGIWRLKWDPYEAKYLLAAGMYGGFIIIDAEVDETPEIVAVYDDHQSIAYGCDWSHLNKNVEKKLKLLNDSNSHDVFLGTCSFYDHCLKLSSIKLDGFTNFV
ncbi:diphthine methyltransferase [Copidosoma floridanum]|uniref:diphthine methyltransferase n=1 Tax=Copidosoma floridanum TaxID=29053 RepID=UPI0006C99A33|nr:diphthine methyltransferase [Copidosoma floridanum]